MAEGRLDLGQCSADKPCKLANAYCRYPDGSCGQVRALVLAALPFFIAKKWTHHRALAYAKSSSRRARRSLRPFAVATATHTATLAWPGLLECLCVPARPAMVRNSCWLLSFPGQTSCGKTMYGTETKQDTAVCAQDEDCLVDGHFCKREVGKCSGSGACTAKPLV